MKRVKQTILGAPGGNCMQAAVATLLEFPLDEVPHFTEGDVDPPYKWPRRLFNWAATKGLGCVMTSIKSCDAWMTGPCILGVRIEGRNTHTNWIHSVVGTSSFEGPGPLLEVERTFDPHPDPGEVSEYVDILWFTPLKSDSPRSSSVLASMIWIRKDCDR